MAKHLFTNNALSTLASGISNVAASLTVSSNQSAFAEPAAGQFQLLTLTDGTSVEIVKSTARSGATITIVRGQEGTTARSWDAGTTTVSARVTAGTLQAVMQNVGEGTDSLAIGPHSGTVPTSAGARAVAIGGDATASLDDAIAIGQSATASGSDAVAVGVSASASAANTVAVGDGATASAQDATAIGPGAAASQSRSAAIGYGAAASSTDAFAGPRSTASASYAVALGGGTASAENAVSVGAFSTASGVQSAAVGRNASAFADRAFAGPHAKVYTTRSWQLHGHPVIPRDDFTHGWGLTAFNTGAEGYVSTPFIDLGTLKAWVGATEYTDGDVVRPTVDNDLQYHLWVDPYTVAGIPNTTTTPAGEPTWPTSDSDSVAADAAELSYWICLDILTGLTLELPPNVLFFPNEVGFVCLKHADVTGAPEVSIGTTASPTLFANAVALSDISGANQRHRIAVTSSAGVSELVFKLATKATGTNSQFLGRFYARGLFIQTQG